MKTFYNCDAGYAEVKEWQPNCWISVTCPNEEDINYLTTDLQAPLDFLKDVEDIEERPRIDFEEGWMMMIMRVPYKVEHSNTPFITVPFGFLMKDDIFISICHYKTEMIPDFIKYTVRKNIGAKKKYDLLLSLFLSSSVWFLKYLKQINSQIKYAEFELEKSIRNEELHQLMRFERCLVYFITSLRSNEILLLKMKKVLKVYNIQYEDDLLDEVDIELQQAYTSANIYSDILSGTMDAYASIISNNLNVIMKHLTSVSIILMIPTLVASFYGMNVPNPFENLPFGFGIIVMISLAFSIGGVLLFRKIRWF